MDEAREYEYSLQARSDELARVAVEPESTSAPETNVHDEARVLTFAELQELIESGRVDQIPNNKVIPESLSVSLPSLLYTGAPLIDAPRMNLLASQPCP